MLSPLTELSVINGCLGTMGEVPIASLDEGHPMLGSAQRLMNLASFREQAKGWWFNTEEITLVPDTVDSFIYLPEDALRIDPTDQSLNYVQRGRRLYKAKSDGTVDQYTFTYSVDCLLIRSLEFDDLPVPAQILIEAATLRDFQAEYDADQAKMAKLDKKYAEAFIAISAEHIRNKGANFLVRASTRGVLNQLTPRVGSRRLPIY